MWGYTSVIPTLWRLQYDEELDTSLELPYVNKTKQTSHNANKQKESASNLSLLKCSPENRKAVKKAKMGCLNSRCLVLKNRMLQWNSLFLLWFQGFIKNSFLFSLPEMGSYFSWLPTSLFLLTPVLGQTQPFDLHLILPAMSNGDCTSYFKNSLGSAVLNLPNTTTL